MKSSCLVVVMLCALGLDMFGQGHLNLKGKVLDSDSGKPLPYASVSIRPSSYGTVTAATGEFELFIPVSEKADSIVVSYIGYKSFKKSLTNWDGDIVVRLDEFSTMLNEVIVSDDAAKQLVVKALNAIPSVYPMTPYLMEGFHRSWEKVDFQDSISYPGTLIEAAVTVYDPGYAVTKAGTRKKEEIYINEVKRSALRDGWNYDGNALRELLNKNPVRNNREDAFIGLKNFLDFPNSLMYEWDGVSSINGESLTVIKVMIPNKRNLPAYYNVYISDKDFAILRIDLRGESKEIDFSSGEWHIEKIDKSIIFKRYLDKVYLNYIRFTYTVKKLDVLKKKILQTEDYSRELLISNVILEDVDMKREQLKSKKSNKGSIANQPGKFNKNFWDSYTTILESPLDKKVIEYFNQEQKKMR